jgi:hypothetical protein
MRSISAWGVDARRVELVNDKMFPVYPPGVSRAAILMAQASTGELHNR